MNSCECPISSADMRSENAIHSDVTIYVGEWKSECVVLIKVNNGSIKMKESHDKWEAECCACVIGLFWKLTKVVRDGVGWKELTLNVKEGKVVAKI